MAEPCEHCFHEPTFKAVERQQEPYRGMWQAIVAWSTERQQRGDPIYPADLTREIHRIADLQPEAAAAFALNTTRYGREDEVR